MRMEKEPACQGMLCKILAFKGVKREHFTVLGGYWTIAGFFTAILRTMCVIGREMKTMFIKAGFKQRLIEFV